MLLAWKVPCWLRGRSSPVDLQIPHDSYPNPSWLFFFCRNWQSGPKIHTDIRRTQSSQNNLENKSLLISKSMTKLRDQEVWYRRDDTQLLTPGTEWGAQWRTLALGIEWFQQSVKTIYWGKNSHSRRRWWCNWIPACRRMDLDNFLIPYTKINSKWIKYLNVRVKTTKLEENPSMIFPDQGLSNGS